MTREEAIKTLKENYCAMCAYGSQDMDSCDIRSCDSKDAIKALEQELVLEKDGTLVVTTEHYCNVGRVLVQYGICGSLFYQD